jgi:hypothetical protein
MVSRNACLQVYPAPHVLFFASSHDFLTVPSPLRRYSISPFFSPRLTLQRISSMITLRSRCFGIHTLKFIEHLAQLPPIDLLMRQCSNLSVQILQRSSSSG